MAAPLFLLPPCGAWAAEGSLALLPFHSEGGETSALERTATAFLRKRLQDESFLNLVPADRTAAIAEELGIGGRRPVDDEKARHLGFLADAEVVIVGTLSGEGEVLSLTARLVGVESLRAEEVRLEGSRVGQIAPLVRSFCDRVVSFYAERKELLALSSPVDLLVDEFRPALAGRTLPRVFLSATEEYEGERRKESATAEVLSNVLREVGFPLVPKAESADVLLFAVFTGRRGERVRSAVISNTTIELRAVDPLQGRLLFRGKLSHSAVDAFASIAGARAFREGVLLAAGSLLPSLAPPSP